MCFIAVVFLLLGLQRATGADTGVLRFILLGDWGKTYYNQAYVAKAMGTWASKYYPSFVLALGDNFYS